MNKENELQNSTTQELPVITSGELPMTSGTGYKFIAPDADDDIDWSLDLSEPVACLPEVDEHRFKALNDEFKMKQAEITEAIDRLVVLIGKMSIYDIGSVAIDGSTVSGKVCSDNTQKLGTPVGKLQSVSPTNGHELQESFSKAAMLDKGDKVATWYEYQPKLSPMSSANVANNNDDKAVEKESVDKKVPFMIQNVNIRAILANLSDDLRALKQEANDTKQDLKEHAHTAGVMKGNRERGRKHKPYQRDKRHTTVEDQADYASHHPRSSSSAIGQGNSRLQNGADADCLSARNGEKEERSGRRKWRRPGSRRRQQMSSADDLSNVDHLHARLIGDRDTGVEEIAEELGAMGVSDSSNRRTTKVKTRRLNAEFRRKVFRDVDFGGKAEDTEAKLGYGIEKGASKKRCAGDGFGDHADDAIDSYIQINGKRMRKTATGTS